MLSITFKGPPQPQPSYLERLLVGLMVSLLFVPFVGVLAIMLAVVAVPIVVVVGVVSSLTGQLKFNYKEK